MIGDAGERDGVAGVAIAGGEGQAEDAGDGPGIIEKGLVEVADAKEQDGVRYGGLLLKILAHGGGESGVGRGGGVDDRW